MAPDHARFLFDFLLPHLKSEQAVTQKILSSAPPDMGGYRPAPRSMSALELARRIAIVEIWFLDAIIHRNFGDVTPLPEAVKTCRDVAECYAENFTRRMPLLEQLSSDDLATPVDFIGLRKDPAVAYLNIAIRIRFTIVGSSPRIFVRWARRPPRYMWKTRESRPVLLRNSCLVARKAV